MDTDWSVLAEYFSARADETEAAHKAMMTRLRLYTGLQSTVVVQEVQQQPARKRKKTDAKVIRRSGRPCDNCHNRHRRCETSDGSKTQACRECVHQKLTCSFV